MQKPDTYTTPLLPGNMYHFYNRGNHFQNVFKCASDYALLNRKWRDYIYPVAKTHCYHLLPNHRHAILEIREQPLKGVTLTAKNKEAYKSGTPIWVSQSISNFFNSYSRTFQNRYATSGALFHSPSKRKLIDTEDFYEQLTGYIHWNAHKHRLTRCPLSQIEHSSYRHILRDSNPLLERGDVLARFGGIERFIRVHEALGDRYT